MDINQVLRRLPKMSDLLEHPEMMVLGQSHHRVFLRTVLSQSLDTVRQRLMDSLKGSELQVPQSENDLMEEVIALAKEYLASPCCHLRPVINATGVVLHTNLGRSVLPPQALEQILQIAGGYSNLEYNIEEGGRGERYSHIREILCELTGAEDALVVNNNAAAVLLCLSAIATGGEVIISRGELVEIGGSFRIPDVMAQSGATLVEVGTTNKTHLEDYKKAINENTALILKVHPSNYKIVGFTSRVKGEDLLKLAKNQGLPIMEDLGSGALIDLTPYGFPKEPTVQDSVKAGIDLVTFSGDKLLGGPQAGIIVGRERLVSGIKRHPLTRAVRIDKLTLSALESVLRLYKSQQWQQIPVLKMLTKPMEDMEEEARLLAEELIRVTGQKGKISILDDVSETGGGSMPGYEIPTKVVALSFHGLSAQDISHILRTARVPIVGRIKRDMYLFDVRTLTKEDIEKIIETVGSLL